MVASTRLITALIISAIFISAFTLLRKDYNTNTLDQDEIFINRRRLGLLLPYNDPATVTIKEERGAHEEHLIIDIYPDSTIAADIEQIVHKPQESTICIRLRQGARCPHPSLVGRLYGKSMTMLEWAQIAPWGELYTEYCGSYANSWIDAGIYFLEVIIIHCKDFGPQQLERARKDPTRQGIGLAKWRAFDYMYECIEDNTHNRLTGDNAYITIDSNHLGVGDKRIGRWALVDNSKIDGNGVPHPQFTRHQPQKCRAGDPDAQLDRCQIPTNNARIENDFRFFWRGDQTWIQDLDRYRHYFPHEFVEQHLPEPTSRDFHASLHAMNFEVDGPKICVLGESHAHHIWQAMFRLNLGHRFVMDSLLYPELEEATKRIHDNYAVHGCKKFIIASGQWASSRLAYENEKIGKPYSFHKFHESLAAIIKSPEIHSIDPNIELYFRTIHLNPLGDLISDCGPEKRPKDWRSPTVIDGYNHVIKLLVRDVKRNNPDLRRRLHFLDTRFINEPMWDTSPDLNHLHKTVGDAEALYIAGKVLLD